MRPQLKKFLDDPTLVLVILGYADKQGDDQKNLEISNGRAQAVMDVLRDQLGIQNVMHSVPMGGTDLLDPRQLAKNLHRGSLGGFCLEGQEGRRCSGVCSTQAAKNALQKTGSQNARNLAGRHPSTTNALELLRSRILRSSIIPSSRLPCHASLRRPHRSHRGFQDSGPISATTRSPGAQE